MPNDEEKKRWRVRTWTMDDFASPDRRVEAQRIEDQLNALEADEYEIYEMDFRKNIIVGCLKEEEADSRPFAGPTPVGQILQDFLASRRPNSAPPSMPQPVEPAAASESEDDFVPEGALTMELFQALNNVIHAKIAGDPYTEKRVTAAVKHLFMKAPIEECRKSLSDLERYHQQHREIREKMGGSCDDGCVMSAVFNLSEEKLRAHLSANPLS